MCRTTEFHGLPSRNQDNHLKIKSFYVRFTGFRPNNQPLPELLTFVYPHHVNGTRDIVIDGSKIQPESKAFLGLQKIVDAEKQEGGETIFGSRERIRVSEGVRFEVYLREERVLEGIFRKDGDGMEKWRLCCYGGGGGVEVATVEVCVEVEGHVILCEKVVKKRRKSWRGYDKLEVIPEERETVEDELVEGCCCDCGEGLVQGCGQVCERVEMDLESVGWAIDVGIWVICLGAGYLISRASTKSLRRFRLL